MLESWKPDGWYPLGKTNYSRAKHKFHTREGDKMKQGTRKIFFWMSEQEKLEYIRQRELILEFDRKLKKLTSNGMEPVHALAKGVYVVFVAMLLWIPFDMNDLSMIAVCTLGANIWPTWIFVSGYLYVNENGKMQSISEKLKYMPVDVGMLRRVRMEYLIQFLKVPCLTAVVAQLLGAWFCNHRITIANILYPVIVMGLYPLLIGWVDIWNLKVLANRR